MSKSFPLKVYQSLCKLNQTVSYVDSSGYGACSLIDFLLSVLCLSRHLSGNSITKVWINTITVGKPKDKLRGLHHLNLFKFLIHCQEIYIDQKLQKQSLIKMFSFICMWKFDFCLEAEVVASPFNTVAAFIHLGTALSSPANTELQSCGLGGQELACVQPVDFPSLKTIWDLIIL